MNASDAMEDGELRPRAATLTHEEFIEEVWKFHANPDNMAKILEAFLPGETRAALDVSTLRNFGDHLANGGRGKFSSGPVFSCSAGKEQRERVLLLFRIERGPSPFCALRLLQDMVDIWDRYTSSSEYGGNGDRLPVILPVVLLAGGGGGLKTKQFEDLLVLGTHFPRHLPRFDFVLCDVEAKPLEEMRRNPPGNCMLLALRANLSRSREKEHARLVADLFPSLHDAQVERCVDIAMRHAAGWSKFDAALFGEALKDLAVERGYAMEDNYVEILFPKQTEMIRERAESKGRLAGLMQGMSKGMSKGYDEGLARGMTRGLLEGDARTCRALLSDCLRLRFGIEDAGMDERVSRLSGLQAHQALLKILPLNDRADAERVLAAI